MTNSSREIIVKAGLMLLAVALPSLISNGSIRIITTAAVFIGILSLLHLLTRKAAARTVAVSVTDKQQGLDFKASMAPVNNFLLEKAQVIPILTNQLQDTIQQTETAVLEIGEKFMDIVSRARSQAKKASNAFGEVTGSEGEDGRSLIEVSKEALAAVIDNLNDVNDVIRQALAGNSANHRFHRKHPGSGGGN